MDNKINNEFTINSSTFCIKPIKKLSPGDIVLHPIYRLDGMKLINIYSKLDSFMLNQIEQHIKCDDIIPVMVAPSEEQFNNFLRKKTYSNFEFILLLDYIAKENIENYKVMLDIKHYVDERVNLNSFYDKKNQMDSPGYEESASTALKNKKNLYKFRFNKSINQIDKAGGNSNFAEKDTPQDLATSEVPYGSKLYEIIHDYILQKNTKSYLKGQKAVEAHKIFKIEKKNSSLSVYMQTIFGWFSSDGGSPAMVSGSSGISARMELKKDSNGQYNVVEYKEAIDVAGSMNKKSIEEMFPKEISDYVIKNQKSINEHLWKVQMKKVKKWFMAIKGKPKTDITDFSADKGSEINEEISLDGKNKEKNNLSAEEETLRETSSVSTKRKKKINIGIVKKVMMSKNMNVKKHQYKFVKKKIDIKNSIAYPIKNKNKTNKLLLTASRKKVKRDIYNGLRIEPNDRSTSITKLLDLNPRVKPVLLKMVSSTLIWDSFVYNLKSELMQNRVKLIQKRFMDFLGKDKSVTALTNEMALFDDLMLSHSTNAACMAMLFGSCVNLNDNEMLEISIAALFSNIGFIKMDNNIYYEHLKGQSSDQIIDLHIKKAYKIMITSSYCRRESIMRGISDHHECFDGSGSPAGKRGRDISLYGKILKIVFDYDDFIVGDLSEKSINPLNPDNIFMKHKENMFDPNIVRDFIKQTRIQVNK